MTSSWSTTRVEGEPLELLVEAFGEFEIHHRGDGSVSVHVELEPRLGEPLDRALKRVESRLLLDDAEQVGLPLSRQRTPEQRATDALVELLQSVGRALESPPGPVATSG
jgi:hypothetical protein